MSEQNLRQISAFVTVIFRLFSSLSTETAVTSFHLNVYTVIGKSASAFISCMKLIPDALFSVKPYTNFASDRF